MANFIITLAPVPFESADDLLAKAKQALKEYFITSRIDGSNAVLVLSTISLQLSSCDLVFFIYLFIYLYTHSFIVKTHKCI